MDPVELNERVARLEEQMKTLQADLTATLEGFRTDMAKRDAASARRETWLLLAVITVIAVGLTIHGFLTS